MPSSQPTVGRQVKVAEVDYADALEATFPGGAPDGCREGDIRCLIVARYSGDDLARDAALDLLDEASSVAGTESEQIMEGGYRGDIRIVPELPVGRYSKHLQWTLSAQREIANVMTEIRKQKGEAVTFRYTSIVYRFMRSVDRTTPSAYAVGWTVAYNVKGSLMTSPTAARDVLFHEIFHLNDQQRDQWSARALGPVVKKIVGRCGTDRNCLKPFAPRNVTVKGGTYYAFQPNNGDMSNEYAAELATRYFTEQSAALKGEVHAGGWFKCGPPESALAMKLLQDEFFAGFDATPICK
jgi:hypothetical protein